MTSDRPPAGNWGLLRPGSHRAVGVADDAAIVNAMVAVELAWVKVLANSHLATPTQVSAISAAIKQWQPDVAALSAQGEVVGNPVVPLLGAIRALISDPDTAALLHRGLTSQDVLDTALMLIAKECVRHTDDDLAAIEARLAELAEEYRETLMVGRTLTQYAVPLTFGLKMAQWLTGVMDAREQLGSLTFPVQLGGAAGTLSLVTDLGIDPARASEVLADDLDLSSPALPWHTRRTPVTRVGDALATVNDLLGAIAANIALLGRPEIAELNEGATPGRGGSSTMPHKQNPVLSVLVKSAAMQAPLLAAQLHLAAAQQIDERADGAWHAEWPALQQLLTLTLTAVSQSRELLGGLEVREEVMATRATDAADSLLAERPGSSAEVPTDADPAGYLGATNYFIDAALTRHRRRNSDV